MEQKKLIIVMVSMVICIAVLLFVISTTVNNYQYIEEAKYLPSNCFSEKDGDSFATFKMEKTYTNIVPHIHYIQNNKHVFDTVCYTVCDSFVTIKVPRELKVVSVDLHYKTKK